MAAYDPRDYVPAPREQASILVSAGSCPRLEWRHTLTAQTSQSTTLKRLVAQRACEARPYGPDKTHTRERASEDWTRQTRAVGACRERGQARPVDDETQVPGCITVQ